MRIGDRVVVVAEWSSFKGMRGTVRDVSPVLMVELDDDPRAVRMGEREVVVLSAESGHIGGAE